MAQSKVMQLTNSSDGPNYVTDWLLIDPNTRESSRERLIDLPNRRRPSPVVRARSHARLRAGRPAMGCGLAAQPAQDNYVRRPGHAGPDVLGVLSRIWVLLLGADAVCGAARVATGRVAARRAPRASVHIMVFRR